MTAAATFSQVKTRTPASAATRVRASIVIVNYNGRATLENSLSSILRTTPPDCEVILVDNASTDGSPQLVRERFPQIRLIYSDENLGFAGGNNLGVEAAGGEYLVFLNPDTAVAPGWLDALLAPLLKDPQVGMTTPKILLMGDTGRINTCGNDVHITGLTLCRGMGQPANVLAEPVEVSAVSGAAFAIRRDLYDVLGGFDHDFFMYMEDTDLSWRARLAGYKCMYAPEAVVYHDYTLRFGPHKTFYQERNRYLMLLKSLRWRTLLALIPALLLAELVTWGFVSLKDRKNWRNKLQAYAWIALNWQKVKTARRQTQALRQASDRNLLACTVNILAYTQTGDGLAARMAEWIFNPLFHILRSVTLALMRW